MSFRPPRGNGSHPGSGIDVLAYELQQEKAATLARMGRRLNEALDALKAFDAAHPAPPEPGTAAAAERAERVDDAGEALWYYVIQREVTGLRDSEAVMRHLGVPREVRLRMGYRPRPATPSTAPSRRG